MFQRFWSLNLILEDETSLEMEINWPRESDDNLPRGQWNELAFDSSGNVDAKIMAEGVAIR